MSTSIDRVVHALGKMQQVERVGGSLPDVTVSVECETPWQGEDLQIHFALTLLQTPKRGFN
jgi:hypothetical protein